MKRKFKIHLNGSLLAITLGILAISAGIIALADSEMRCNSKAVYSLLSDDILKTIKAEGGDSSGTAVMLADGEITGIGNGYLICQSDLLIIQRGDIDKKIINYIVDTNPDDKLSVKWIK